MFIFRLLLHNNLNTFGSPASTASHRSSLYSQAASLLHVYGEAAVSLNDHIADLKAVNQGVV